MELDHAAFVGSSEADFVDRSRLERGSSASSRPYG